MEVEEGGKVDVEAGDSINNLTSAIVCLSDGQSFDITIVLRPSHTIP